MKPADETVSLEINAHTHKNPQNPPKTNQPTKTPILPPQIMLLLQVVVSYYVTAVSAH